MKQMCAREILIDAGHNTGYISSSGFRDAFSKMMGANKIRLTLYNSNSLLDWYKAWAYDCNCEASLYLFDLLIDEV